MAFLAHQRTEAWGQLLHYRLSFFFLFLPYIIFCVSAPYFIYSSKEGVEGHWAEAQRREYQFEPRIVPHRVRPHKASPRRRPGVPDPGLHKLGSEARGMAIGESDVQRGGR